MKTHQELDERSLIMHRLIADKIRRDPALFECVRQTLARWQGTVCLSSKPYLDEWNRRLEEGMESCLALAEENSEYATAMRQSSPFCGILSHRERFSFLKSWGQRHEAQGS